MIYIFHVGFNKNQWTVVKGLDLMQVTGGEMLRLKSEDHEVTLSQAVEPSGMWVSQVTGFD